MLLHLNNGRHRGPWPHAREQPQCEAFFRDVGEGAQCRRGLRQPAAGSGDVDLGPAATRPPFLAPVAAPAVRLDCRAREILRNIRAEYLDQAFYWNARDLEQKLASFRDYCNAVRVHQGLSGDTPAEKVGGSGLPLASLLNYRWQSHCHGLVQLPIAA